MSYEDVRRYAHLHKQEMTAVGGAAAATGAAVLASSVMEGGGLFAQLPEFNTESVH